MPKTVPLVGDPVRYLQGKAHKVLSLQLEPNGRFHFVTVEDPDNPGQPAATLASYLLELNTDDGWTFFPNLAPPPTGAPAPGQAHLGDPRFPLTEEHDSRHRRFNRLVERAAQIVVQRWEDARDTPASPARAWSSIPEHQRERVRRGMRAALLRKPALNVTPAALQNLCNQVATQIIPEDLKQWLDANP